MSQGKDKQMPRKAKSKKSNSREEVPQIAQPATPGPAPSQSKQQQTLDNLKAKWTERGVDLLALEVKLEGKFLLVTVGPDWPLIRIGPSGGGEIPALKSYPKFFDACVDADELLRKQTEREEKKKAAASAPQKEDESTNQ
jgi:hypothetical protein